MLVHFTIKQTFAQVAQALHVRGALLLYSHLHFVFGLVLFRIL